MSNDIILNESGLLLPPPPPPFIIVIGSMLASMGIKFPMNPAPGMSNPAGSEPIIMNDIGGLDGCMCGIWPCI